MSDFKAGTPVRIQRKPGEKYNGQVGRILDKPTTLDFQWVAINNANPYQIPDERNYTNTDFATPALIPTTSLR